MRYNYLSVGFSVLTFPSLVCFYCFCASVSVRVWLSVCLFWMCFAPSCAWFNIITATNPRFFQGQNVIHGSVCVCVFVGGCYCITTTAEEAKRWLCMHSQRGRERNRSLLPPFLMAQRVACSSTVLVFLLLGGGCRCFLLIHPVARKQQKKWICSAAALCKGGLVSRAFFCCPGLFTAGYISKKPPYWWETVA